MKMPSRFWKRFFTALLLSALSCALTPPIAHAQKPHRTSEFALVANSPEFWRLVAPETKLHTMGSGFGFTEGPVWDKRGFLWVSDEETNKIFRLYPDGHRDEAISLGDPDGNTFDKANQLIDCASVLRAIIRLSKDGTTYTVLADRCRDKRFNSPNDIVMGPDGALYFTDPTLDLPKGQLQETPYQGVYRLDSEGQVRLLTTDLTQPNGLAFSPDGNSFYVDDTAQKVIWVYRFNRDGTISNGRIFGSEDSTERDGVPDGMRVDVAGNILVTGPRGIWVWSPEGVHLGTIELPEQPANLAWGGDGMRTLYITAGTSVYTLDMNTRGFIPYE